MRVRAALHSMKAYPIEPRLDERLSDVERRFEGVEEALALVREAAERHPRRRRSPGTARRAAGGRVALEPVCERGVECTLHSAKKCIIHANRLFWG